MATSVSTSVANKYGIRPFDGTGYDAWKYRVRILLRQEGVEELIDQPVPGVRSQDDAWKAKDGKCSNLLVSNIADNMLNILCTQRNARGIWKALEANFTRVSDDRIVELRDQLNNIPYKVEDDMRQFVMRYRAIVNELGTLNCPITTKQHMLKLLKKLPPEFFVIQMQLETLNMMPSWDDLNNQLVNAHRTRAGAIREFKESDSF